MKANLTAEMVLTITDSVITNKVAPTSKGSATAGNRKSRSVNELKTSSSFANLVPDTPDPCFSCRKSFEPPYKAIQCDKCASWVHAECSDLNPEQYKFLCRKNNPSSIKWFCHPCEVKEDKPESDNSNESIEKLANVILQITQQNAEILHHIKREKMVEEKIKVNVSEILEDQKEKEDRKNNIIIFNVPEEEDNEEGKENDRRTVSEVCNFVTPGNSQVTSPNQIKIERLGPRRKPSTAIPSPRPRPIKVYLDSSSDKDKILGNARILKNSPYQHVGISADKTRKEREQDFITRNELRRRRNDGEDVVLFRGEIYLRNEAPWLRKNRNESAQGPGAQGTTSSEGDPSKDVAPGF